MCTTNIENVTALYPLRSYRVRGSPPLPCTILQAACACVSSIDTFLPATIGIDTEKVKLINALSGFANPGKELLQEAQRAFGDSAEIATILSIGAGKGDIWKMSALRDSLEMGDALKRIATNCEPVHEELYTRLRETGIYFRLNVERESTSQVELTSTRVSAYLQEGSVNEKVDEAIKSIYHRPNGAYIRDINSVKVIEVTLKPRPSLVQNFVGRQDILEAIHRVHISNRSDELRTPAMTVLSGIGGSGKSQIALKFALDFEKL